MIKKSNFDINRARAAFSKVPGAQTTDRPSYYPFHKLPENKSATLRFIPDANPDNELGFLIERRMHEIVSDGEKTRVACLEMYGKKCPICDLSRSYYKAKDTVNGKKYWHKKDYMSKAIVVKDGLPPGEDGETYVGKVVIVNLGKTLYDIIAHNISSGDLGDDLPCDIENGFDFIITRTTKPGPNGEKWSDYGLSKFARAPRALEDEEVALLEHEDESGGTPNFIDLSTMLPKEPDTEFVENLLEQSLGGGSSDDEDEPAPRAAPKAGSAASKFGKSTAKQESEDEEDEPAPAPKAVKAAAKPAPKEEDGDDEAEAQAFLAQIRAKRAAQKATAEE